MLAIHIAGRRLEASSLVWHPGRKRFGSISFGSRHSSEARKRYLSVPFEIKLTGSVRLVVIIIIIILVVIIVVIMILLIIIIIMII